MARRLHGERGVTKPEWTMIDGNEAAASVAFRLSEVVAIYPITPASPMGELADAWAAQGKSNVWGAVPSICEMQSEGGAAGAVHGALQAGSLATTFTASQGLLLMLPNMFKIAGELTAGVLHVAARTIATHALSIFGDHSDVMTARTTGYALLASSTVQEAHDLAAVAHAATLRARVPFLHFFDGFRTSHEINKIQLLPDEVLSALVPEALVLAHRQRALDPDRPVLRGTAQNPDVFFQAREAANPFYAATPGIVAEVMEAFAELTGRRYRLFDYVGHPEAERVVISMGSGADTVGETVRVLAAQGEKVGALIVRLYRPFSAEHFLSALPETCRRVVVLDRTKEPGAPGEPLYLDVVTALAEAAAEGRRTMPRVIGGRYGLSSKEFTPGMVRGALENLGAEAPKNHFTLGIVDDVSGTSLDYDASWSVEPEDVYRALFFGLGSDGTVGANKNTIKIIGESTEHAAQGYFVYDSKKAGATTVSHLRFGDTPIHAPYLIDQADFLAVHHPVFLERFDVLERARPGATFLLNSALPAADVWRVLPKTYQRHIVEKKLDVWTIDAAKVATEAGLGNRINTVMQVAFFKLSGVLPIERAVAEMKATIDKTYGKKGKALVERNYRAVDSALAHLERVAVPDTVDADFDLAFPVPEVAPDFVKRVTGRIIAGAGDLLPVSAFPIDGTFPTGTARWEKRNIADQIPVWDSQWCIQCNKCALVCPHAAIRTKVFDVVPEGYPAVPYKGKDLGEGRSYAVQVAPEDCTGCRVCVEVCPAKNKTEVKKKAINMTPKPEVFAVEQARWSAFEGIPELDRRLVRLGTVKGSQLLQPLFEFSGACAGCGETPYLKLLTQLFGDRMMVANATGCSSIYGGNLPTTPWTVDGAGRGPAWSNSLFEDNAEFGLGMRLALDAKRSFAGTLLTKLAPRIGEELVDAMLQPDPRDEAGYAARREQVELLRRRLAEIDAPEARALSELAGQFVPRSMWIVGGDGWAYDIGYGGLDHVLASGLNVNVLVMDTEVYSNTGGQMSKATPKGAVAKFAAAGKRTQKKDIGLMAIAYGDVYVARIAMGANDAQTVRALMEADAYPGPSLVLAYSHCIAHGINMAKGMEQQNLAVKSGYWPLLRFDPRRAEAGEPGLELDSKAPSVRFSEYVENEGRYRMLRHAAPEIARRLQAESEAEIKARFELYTHLATRGATEKETSR